MKKDFYILFIEELDKMHNATRQIMKGLPLFISAANSTKLKKALRHHLIETEKQMHRLKVIASEFNEKLTPKENNSIKHILNEAKNSIFHCHDSATKDAAIIMNMQKIQHYEMACYGSLKSFAKHFKLHHILELLEESSKEEGHMDKKLTEIAEGTFFDSGVNAKARKLVA